MQFHEIYPVGAEFHVDGWMDRWTGTQAGKANCSSLQLFDDV